MNLPEAGVFGGVITLGASLPFPHDVLDIVSMEDGLTVVTIVLLSSLYIGPLFSFVCWSCTARMYSYNDTRDLCQGLTQRLQQICDKD